MNGNFIRAGFLVVAVGALMTGAAYADAYDQATPSLPPITGSGGSKIIPPAPPPPPPLPKPAQQGSDNMTMPQGGSQGMQQPAMDSNMPMQQGSDMNAPPPQGDMNQGGMNPGGMRAQPPGMSGGRSNAPMPPPPAGGGQPGGGTMAPPSGSTMQAPGGRPQSKRAPAVKSKTKVSKKQ
jgi:hypothetical protein